MMPEIGPAATMPPPGFDGWLAALEARHMTDMRFSDVVRALRALSSTYVERRTRLEGRGSLDSRGKRAAFALSYGPRHFLLVQAIVRHLPGALDARSILDLGCGTGAAGAGWAAACLERPRVAGLDSHPWAVSEAAQTYRAFASDSSVARADVSAFRLPRRTDAIVAAFVANELEAPARARLLQRLLDANAKGVAVLVVEPLSTRVAPWWPEWLQAFEGAGGRAETWRMPAALPDIVARLDEAAGFRRAELTGRSLWLPPAPSTGE